MRVVIVDDDRFVCGSLSTILGAQEDIEVVAAGHDGFAAEALYRQHHPDILLTDIQMPGRSGLEAAATILAEDPSARVVLLTTFVDDEYIVQALRLGAKGYLIKQDVATIAPALRLVMTGQSVLGGEVMGKVDRLVRQPIPPDRTVPDRTVPDRSVPDQSVLDRTVPDQSPSNRVISSASPHPDNPGTSTGTSTGTITPLSTPPVGAPPTAPPPDSPLVGLTPRELQVTELVAQGLDNRQIAASLHLGEGTVRNLISLILQKLGLRNRTQLAILYYRN